MQSKTSRSNSPLRRGHIAGAASVFAMLSAPAVHAQAQAPSPQSGTGQPQIAALEEIIVTAERRTGDVQKTALSVSVRSGSDMIDQGKYSLQSILEDVPGITGGAALNLVGSDSSGTDAMAAGLTIRGIQSNSGTGGGITSVATAAAIYVDGVYEGVGGGYDIDRVEVLRGPQGTLYGRSATSGVVAIHTRKPDLTEFGGNVTVEGGDYSLQHYAGALNVPLITDKLAVRIVGNRYERDGYYFTEGDALANTDAKVKVLYQPSETVSILVGGAWQNNDTHSGGTIDLVSADDPALTPGQVGTGENTYHQYWAEVNWDLGPAKLTYLPALRTWESDAIAFNRSPVQSFDQTIRTPKDRFWTHELRLASTGDSDLTWLMGTLYYNNELENRSTNVQVGDQPPLVDGQILVDSDTDRETTAVGVFAEATYAFTTDWRVTGGLRYDSTEVETSQIYTSSNGVTLLLNKDDGTRKFDNVTYKARLEHDLTPNNMLYGSVSTGFSPGDVVITTGSDGSPMVVELRDQTLTSFEIGSKNRYIADTLQVNASVYYYDYDGYQTAGINTSTNPANPTFTTLSSPLEAYGAELELVYRVTTNDRVGLNLAYTDSHYVDKDSVALADGRTFADFYARDRVAGVAPVTGNLFYERYFDLPGGSSLSFRGDARYLSAHDEGRITAVDLAAGFRSFVRVDDQVIGNLSATWANGRYSLTAYVRNISDEQYKTGVGSLVSGAYTTELSDPRTVGAVLTVDF